MKFLFVHQDLKSRKVIKRSGKNLHKLYNLPQFFIRKSILSTLFQELFICYNQGQPLAPAGYVF
jgi:hypothetical protein